MEVRERGDDCWIEGVAACKVAVGVIRNDVEQKAHAGLQVDQNRAVPAEGFCREVERLEGEREDSNAACRAEGR